MKQLMLLLTIAAVLVVLPTISIAETISANFEGGAGSVDTWKGTGGDGWVAAWTTRTDNNASLTGTVTNTSPLRTSPTSSQNYLSVDILTTAAGGGATFGRKYDTTSTGPQPDKIDTTQDYTISWLFRADDLSTFFNAGGTPSTADRYQFYQSNYNGLNKGGGSNDTWIINVFGASMANGAYAAIPAGNFCFNDYTGDGTSTNRKWDSEVTITQGVTYAFQVTIHPKNPAYPPTTPAYTWDAKISDVSGTTLYEKTNMGCRATVPCTNYLELFGRGSAKDEHVRCSVDEVVVYQVPEPSILVMGLAAVLAGLAARRRK